MPPIPDRLNLSPDMWLQTIAGLAKQRSANSVTPASRFNAAVNTTLQSVTSNRLPEAARSSRNTFKGGLVNYSLALQQIEWPRGFTDSERSEHQRDPAAGADG